MTDKKPAEAVELPLLEMGGPDERLFIGCGCGHVAAYHGDLGCQRIIDGASRTYSGQSTKPDTQCACPTPREVVYLCGKAAS